MEKEINKKKIPKNCWLSRYRRLSSKIELYVCISKKLDKRTKNKIRNKYLKKYWRKK